MSRPEHNLSKTLGLRGLVLMQLILVMGVAWVGLAARQGPVSWILWLIAGLTFLLPLVITIGVLVTRFPLEGGIYKWISVGVGPLAGWVGTWNFWCFQIFLWSTLGAQTSNDLIYLLELDSPFSSAIVSVIHVTLIIILTGLNCIGLKIASTFSQIVAVAGLLVFITISGAFIYHCSQHPSAWSAAFAWTLPSLSVNTLHFIAKMGLNALGGLEQVAIFAGEVKKPEKNIPTSLLISAPLILLLYILATGAMLLYVPANRVDFISPLAQLTVVALGPYGQGWAAPSVMIVLSMMSIAQCSIAIGEVSRLPMVMGWDDLLPRWFGRLHPKTQSPVNSLVVVGGIIALCGCLMSIFFSHRDAFQAIVSIAMASYGICYTFVFFAVAMRGGELSPAVGLFQRGFATFGLIFTVIAICFQFVPLFPVENDVFYSVTVLFAVIASNIICLSIYRFGVRKPL